MHVREGGSEWPVFFPILLKESKEPRHSFSMVILY